MSDTPAPSAGRGQTREERWAQLRRLIPTTFNSDRELPIAIGALAELLDDAADLRSRLAAAEARVHDYENGITWDTTCLNCASLVDANYEQYVALDALRAGIQALADEWDGTAAAIPPGQPNPAGRRDSLRVCSASLRSLLSETVINE